MAGRILVALDNRDLDAALLDAAAQLAAMRKAELVGLYVEESDFVTAAGLPFIKSFSPQGGWRHVDPEEMRRAFRVRAEDLRREFDLRCRARQIAWQLRTARGAPTEQLVKASDDAELVVIGRSRRARHGPLGSTARRAIAECRAPVLLLDQHVRWPKQVLAIYTGDDAILDAAADMARLFEVPVRAAVLADEESQAERHRVHVEEWLAARGWWSRVKVLDAREQGTVRSWLSGQSPSLLVVKPRSGAGGADLAALLDIAEGPVLSLCGP